LLRDIKDVSVGTLSTRISNQLDSLKGLGLHLKEIRDYLGKVASGELPVNHEIVTHLQDIFNLLPNLNIPETVKSFAVMTNDEMLGLYLSSLVRSVIALHGLIDNKIMLKESESKQDEKTLVEKTVEKTVVEKSV